VAYDGDWRETFRPDIPSVARVYDYLLGGKDNYPVDREVAWPPEWRPDPGDEVPDNAAESYYRVVVARTN
jgi:hypothetical protein